MKYQHLIYFLIVVVVFACKEDDGVVPKTDVTVDELLSRPISINMNPNQLTPLAGIGIVATKSPSTITYEIQGTHPIGNEISKADTLHTFYIYGFYAGRANEVEITITDQESGLSASKIISVTTPALPDFMPDIEVVVNDEAQREPGWNLMEMSVGGNNEFLFYPLIFDPAGEIRWYLDLSFSKNWIGPFERLQNGNWLWAYGDNIYETNMVGSEIKKWAIPGYWQHHDVIEKSNGNLIALVSKGGVPTWSDHVIEVDRQTKAIVKEWDLRQVLDIDRYDLIWNEMDWLHPNSVWYDDNDGGLVISGRHQGIFKVSGNNHLEWILAPDRGWGQAGTDGQGIQTSNYLLQAIDPSGIPYSNAVQQGNIDGTDFSWSWGQHAAMVLPNGNIFCFDNGWRKSFSNTANAGFSRAVEYKVDAANKTVQQVWQYGKQRGAVTFSGNISDVDYLPQTGNRLFCPGNIYSANPKEARMVEVTHPDGDVVFEAVIKFENRQSNGGGWMQADMAYRMERISLYPE